MRYRFLRFPEGKIKAVTLSYDDGVRADLRLAELCDRYGVKCTFNVNSERMNSGGADSLRAEEICEHILSKGHEVAVHGKRHMAPGVALPVQGIADVLECRKELEQAFGRIVRGMAYPDSGVTKLHNGNDYGAIRSYLQSLGIAYSRTLGSDNNSFMLPTDWYNWTPTIKHTNKNLAQWTDEFLAIHEGTVRWSGKYPRLFYIWGHSYEFDNDQNWDLIEGFLSKISGQADVWYATNIEIYEYVTAYNSLITSADGATVYNPTLKEIWFWADGLYSIKPGETLVVK
ncbi:MAG: polysaccharide deacetylase family protein [Clostridia bacterium]|nr:polysaccharide deacetylase family protein [Clostridia bacterium]